MQATAQGGEAAATNPKIDKLCRLMVAEHGWRVLAPAGGGASAGEPWPLVLVPELAELATQFDRVLVRWDRVSLLAVCIRDRTRPGSRPVDVPRERLVAVARALRRYCNRVYGVRMAAGVEVWEIGQVLGDVEHLHELRPAGPRRGEVHVGAWSLGLDDEQVWTSLPLGGALALRDQIERLLFAIAADDPPPLAESPPLALVAGRRPWTTWGLVALLALVFARTVAADGIAPSMQTLYELGGLHGPSVVAGDWHRLVTAMFLHGNALHLALNLGPLVVAGATLEALLGRAHLVALFVLCGLGGTLASLSTIHPRIVSVGASGAVIGLLVCGLFVARRLPVGGVRAQAMLQLYWWAVPALLSTLLAVGSIGIDYAAHLGGAAVGALAGYALLRAAPRELHAEVLPRGARAAAVGAGLLVAACFARAWFGGDA